MSEASLSNSDAVKKRVAELRALIRAAEGRIERRRTAIIFAQNDIRDESEWVRVYERELEELGSPRKRK